MTVQILSTGFCTADESHFLRGGLLCLGGGNLTQSGCLIVIVIIAALSSWGMGWVTTRFGSRGVGCFWTTTSWH